MNRMLEINKPILVDNPYRLLQYERGVFKVVSPSGNCVRVICPLDLPPANEQLRTEGTEHSRGWWRIEKIA
jgi:hypothetical protein